MRSAHVPHTPTLVVPAGLTDAEADAKLRLAYGIFVSSKELMDQRYGGKLATTAHTVHMCVLESEYDKLVGSSSTLAWFGTSGL